MICKNCGSEMADDMRFCDKCGTAVDAAETKEPVTEEPVEEVTPAPVEEPTENETTAAPKKGGKGLKIVAIVLAVLILLGGVGFLFRDKITGLFVGMSSPTEQLQYTYSRAAGNLTSGLVSTVESTYGRYTGDYTLEGNLTVSASDEMLALAGIDDYIDANEVTIAYKTATDGDIMYVNLKALVGKAELLTADVYVDTKNSAVLVSLPGIIDETLKIDLSVLEGLMETDEILGVNYNVRDVDLLDGYSIDSNDFLGYLELLGLDSDELVDALVELLPDEETMENIIVAVVEAAFKEITDVSDAKAEFDAYGVKQTATCLKAKVTEKTVLNMAKSVLNEVRDNKDIKAYLSEVMDEVGELFELDALMPKADDIYKEYQAAIDGLLAEIPAAETADAVLFELNTWVNGDYEILAAELVVPGTDGGTIFLGNAVNGADAGIEFSAIGADGTELFVFGGKYTEKDGKVTGEFKLTADEMDIITAKLIDFSEEKGGTIVLAFSEDIGKEMEYDMGFDISDYALKLAVAAESSNKAVATVALTDAKDIEKEHVSVNLSESYKDGADVTVPKYDTEDVEEWASGLDVFEVIKRLGDIGISQEALAYLFS
ncbi:MAG: zinc-ribbon domain-containing protein [Clostridia bacterium]|nr:zinc-ribbon domain-containing protein [Clostridia bacterium]